MRTPACWCRPACSSEADGRAIADGLDRVEAEFRDGSFAVQPTDEDIHTAVERRLTELVGDAGRRLHTGRSRNDQVATDVLLYLRDAVDAQRAAITDLASILVDQAARHLDTLLPGYTHLQRAQPVRLAHHLLAYVQMLIRDQRRFGQVRRAVPGGIAAAAPGRCRASASRSIVH